MLLVSVTRLHLRSSWFYPQFLWYALRSTRQVKKAPGFLGGNLASEGIRGFWTITSWAHEEAMRAFRSSRAHRAAMPRLLRWCDEASYTHWTETDSQVPSVEEAHRRLRESGRLSKVYFPSGAQRAGRLVSEQLPQPGLVLTPRSS